MMIIGHDTRTMESEGISEEDQESSRKRQILDENNNGPDTKKCYTTTSTASNGEYSFFMDSNSVN